jgi:predicted NAD/FAD-binding protein
MCSPTYILHRDSCWVVCRFDAVVLATHSDISLSLLGAGATAEESSVLSAIPYNNNDIYLHTDEALMPVSASQVLLHGCCTARCLCSGCL